MRHTEQHWDLQGIIYSLYSVDNKDIYCLKSDYDPDFDMWDIYTATEVPYFIRAIHPGHLFQYYSEEDTDFKWHISEDNTGIKQVIYDICNAMPPEPSVDGDPKHVYPSNLLKTIKDMNIEQYSNWINHLRS